MTPRFDLATFLENATPTWLKRVFAWWQRLHRCKGGDWSMYPPAHCVLHRKHGGLHDDGDGHTWLNQPDRSPSYGHVVHGDRRRR